MFAFFSSPGTHVGRRRSSNGRFPFPRLGRRACACLCLDQLLLSFAFSLSVLIFFQDAATPVHRKKRPCLHGCLVLLLRPVTCLCGHAGADHCTPAHPSGLSAPPKWHILLAEASRQRTCQEPTYVIESPAALKSCMEALSKGRKCALDAYRSACCCCC